MPVLGNDYAFRVLEPRNGGQAPYPLRKSESDCRSQERHSLFTPKTCRTSDRSHFKLSASSLSQRCERVPPSHSRQLKGDG